MEVSDVALRTLELFAGAGGGALGSVITGHQPVCYVEIDHYRRRLLRQRIADGMLPDAPIWDDVRTFDGRPWRGCVDVVSGGFPCQDISVAGNGRGITGSQSGLWSEMARIVREVEPGFVWVENSPALTSRGLGVVLRDLATMGFDAEWGVLGADAVGAPHRRHRIWLLAYPDKERRKKYDFPTIADQSGQHRGCDHAPQWWRKDPSEWPAKSRVDRVADGVADRVDRVKAIGDGQVPAVASIAWRILWHRVYGVPA